MNQCWLDRASTSRSNNVASIPIPSSPRVRSLPLHQYSRRPLLQTDDEQIEWPVDIIMVNECMLLI